MACWSCWWSHINTRLSHDWVKLQQIGIPKSAQPLPAACALDLKWLQLEINFFSSSSFLQSLMRYNSWRSSFILELKERKYTKLTLQRGPKYRQIQSLQSRTRLQVLVYLWMSQKNFWKTAEINCGLIWKIHKIKNTRISNWFSKFKEC